MAKLLVILLVFGCSLYIFSQLCTVDGRWVENLPVKTDANDHKKELLDVLHNVLEKLQNRRIGSWDRRSSRLPGCAVGDQCSVKKGPRFGQLCDCPQGSKCSSFFLKCL